MEDQRSINHKYNTRMFVLKYKCPIMLASISIILYTHMYIKYACIKLWRERCGFRSKDICHGTSVNKNATPDCLPL